MYKGWIDRSETFRPNDPIKRGEFVKILNKCFGLSKSSGKVFEDTKNHWAKYEIDIAVTNGVCEGVSKIKFNPMGKITRAEAVTTIGRIN